MSRRESVWIGVSLLVLCTVAFVVAGRLAAHGHIVVAMVLAGVASISGVVVLLAAPSRVRGRR